MVATGPKALRERPSEDARRRLQSHRVIAFLLPGHVEDRSSQPAARQAVARRELPDILTRLAPLNAGKVGMARCAVRAAYQRRNATLLFAARVTSVPPAGTRAGTSQRDVPTRLRFIRKNVRRLPRITNRRRAASPLPSRPNPFARGPG